MRKLINSRLVGQTIKHLRVSRNLTQDQLADIVGYSVRNLRRIENDGTMSIDVVNTFAATFEVSALDILNGDVF
ncbi:MAG: helix-turn-helix transcriptional regulator [Bacilli bacterium]|nr:helix-turn-helix transcriptional regulator [Bacilli bacterium]